MANTQQRKNMDGYTPTQHLRRVPKKMNGEIVGYDVQKYTVWSPVGDSGINKSSLGGGLEQMAEIPEGSYVAIEVPSVGGREIVQIEDANGEILGYASRENFSQWALDVGGEVVYVEGIEELDDIIAFVKNNHESSRQGSLTIPEGWEDKLSDDNYTTETAIMDASVFGGSYEGAMSPANVMGDVKGGDAREIIRQVGRDAIMRISAGERCGEFPSGIRFPTRDRNLMIEVAAEDVGDSYPMYTVRRVDISDHDAPRLVAEEIYLSAGDLRSAVERAGDPRGAFGDKF